MIAVTDNESEPATSTASNFSSSITRSHLCRHFKFSEILSATENFDESSIIGRGGFGKVYKGNTYNGSIYVTAAIKRLDATSNQGASEFWAEVEMLSKLRHCHLVSLFGYCNHETEMILVYEYMPRGTLEDHLHKLATPLSWCQRLKICIGAARGLDYLHTGTGLEFGIIHRDVKSSNILLHENWAAKVSDFGLSKISPKIQPLTHVSTLVKGTFGYFDPNYFATGKLTRKSDVYAFGVVLLEVLCRKRAVDESLDWGLVAWFKDSIKTSGLKGIVDSDIRHELSTKCLKHYAQIAERCLDNHPKNRPTMAEVVLSLEYVLTLHHKTKSLMQSSGKTIFGRMADILSFTEVVQNSAGMDFKSFMPKKPLIGMDLGCLMPKKRKELMHRQKILQQNGATSVNIFRAEEMEKATLNFAENMIIARGYHGSLYKGILPDQCVVAIKRSRTSDQIQLEQFINELVILGQISHANVLPVLGCCLETEIPFLVYKFATNYSLHHQIRNKANDNRSLSWDSRLRIAHESAGALAYLHSDATMLIIHGDVKSSNILLDENYNAKVSDFRASKSVPFGDDQVFTPVRGTLGYIDPEYLHTSQLTDKSDVYSFGVVLAELLTGLNPIDSERFQEERYLAAYFMKAERENRLLEIVDPQVLEEATDEQLEAAYNLVCRCLHKEGGNRPSMKQVSIELLQIRKSKGMIIA